MGKMSTRQVFAPAVKHQVQVVATVTVFYSDGLYHAVDWGAGVHLISNATFSTVVNSAATYLASGGTILIKRGTYTITASLVINFPAIMIRGEGSFYSTIIQTSLAIDMLQVSQWGFAVADIEFAGGDQATSGIHTTSAGYDFYMSNVIITHIKGHGLWIQTSTSPNWYYVIINSAFEYCQTAAVDGCGILLDPQTNIASEICIYGCQIKLNDISVRLTKAGSAIIRKVHISHCTITAYRTAMSLGDPQTIQEILIIDNTIQGGDRYAIALGDVSPLFLIANEILSGTGYQTINQVSSSISGFHLIGNYIVSLPVADDTYQNAYIRTTGALILSNRFYTVGANQCSYHLYLYNGTKGIVTGNVFENGRKQQVFFDDNFTNAIIKDNLHVSPPALGCFRQDVITNTKFATKVIQFQQGGDVTGLPVLAQFISADGSAKGWEVNAADEWAIALGQLPKNVQQVVRIIVWAVGLAAPGVGNKMLMALLANGAQSDEPFNTEAVSVVNKISREINFAVNDVISWVFTRTDDADIGDLIGGDDLEVKAKYNAVVGADIATNAIIRSVEIEYV